MAFIGKCPKCGCELTDTASATCPMCGAPLLSLPTISSSRIWIAAMVQAAIATTFMLVFRFPKFMIVPFVLFILLGTAASTWMKAKGIQVGTSAAQGSLPRPPLARPTLFRIATLGVAICSLALFSSLLFGFVIFMNSWNRWQQYEGQPYHHSEFQVTRAYFQKGNKGATYVDASGTVEGQTEWMNLRPYLTSVPRSQDELDLLVGRGTSIAILYYPGLKGRARVQVDDGTPPAEAGRRDAMNALKYGFLGFSVSASLIFALNRLRRSCYAPSNSDASFSAVAGG